MDPRIEETTAQDQMLVVDEDDDEFFEHPQGELFKDLHEDDVKN